MIDKELFNFLKILYDIDNKLNTITEQEVKKLFKNNKYYNVRKYCLDNNFIKIEYNNVYLTFDGLAFFKNLNKLRYF